MSYILEALKRAEAERERGSLPTLMSQPLSADAPRATSSATRPSAGPRLAVGLIALLVILVLGAWLGRVFSPDGAATAEPTAAPQTHPAHPALPAPNSQMAAAAPAASSNEVLQQAPAIEAAPISHRVTPPPPAQELVPAPAAALPTAEAHAQQAKPAPLQPEARPAPAAPVAVQAAAPVATAPAIPMLKELPAGLRRELPALSTSGAMYSETPSKRMLIINGQLLQEGARVTPDLTLEQIELKSAVLSFKGQRFRISY
ncbi:general secretion pathway protein GspB [Roseateles sp.]|uniref:general secretion pathway protein GspB n=1 Tax=Roseateles sp. TaxID=1971397 RepID=UPI003BA5E24D